MSEEIVSAELVAEPEIDETWTPVDALPTRKGLLKTRCKCGHVSTVSPEPIDNGLTFTMLMGNEHFITLVCEECGSQITMFIEEILENNELSQEGDEE